MVSLILISLHSRSLPLLYSPPPPPFFRMLFFSFVYFVIKSMTKCNVILLVKTKSNELSCSIVVAKKRESNESLHLVIRGAYMHREIEVWRFSEMTLYNVHSHYKSIGFFDISSFYEFVSSIFPRFHSFLAFLLFFFPTHKKTTIHNLFSLLISSLQSPIFFKSASLSPLPPSSWLLSINNESNNKNRENKTR